MLLPAETLQKFGYDTNSLSEYSRKKILVSCDYCNTIHEKSYVHYIAGKKNTVIAKDACFDCKTKKQQESIVASGGMKAIQQKRSVTNLTKYGCVAPANNPDIQTSIQAENIKKYGVTHAIKSAEVQQKIKAANLANSGFDNPFKNPKIQQQIKTKILAKYGVKIPSQIAMPRIAVERLADREWLLDQHHHQKKCLTQIAIELGLSATSKTVGDACLRHGIEIRKYIVSSVEKEIIEILQGWGIECFGSNRQEIAPKELDIFIPSLKIAIEYCGLYWHSDQYLSSTYHLEKKLLCEKVGIRLITIFEDEWLEKKNICISRLRSVVGKLEKEQARKCEVRTGNYSHFLETHHLQSACDGSSVQYGLFCNNELLSVMTFGKPRFSNEAEWELLRYVSTKNVMGGAAKLLAAFVAEHAPASIISYCDLRWGSGKIYEMLGFSLVRNTRPGYFYIKDQKRYSRYSFTKKILVEKYGGNPSLTEKQIMESMDFSRIYDCGNGVYLWKTTQ